MLCLRVLMGTVMVLTAVIYGTEVWVENRIAVDSYIEPAGAAKKKKVTLSLIYLSDANSSTGLAATCRGRLACWGTCEAHTWQRLRNIRSCHACFLWAAVRFASFCACGCLFPEKFYTSVHLRDTAKPCDPFLAETKFPC